MVIATGNYSGAYTFYSLHPVKVKITNYNDLLNDSNLPAAGIINIDTEPPIGESDDYVTSFQIQVWPSRLALPIVTKLEIIPEDQINYKNTNYSLQWTV